MRIGVLGSGMVGSDSARGTEAYLLLWVRLYGAMNTGILNTKLMK